jgi:hypothetical protein
VSAAWGRSVLPRVLFLNATRRCNIDCPRCYITAAHRAGRDAVPVDLVHKALRDPFFRDHAGPVVVIHQGGEIQTLGRERLTALVQAVAEAAPHARQTAVSNMFTAAPWFLELARTWFGGRIETTWAAGRKSTLAGDGPAYQARFEQSMRAAIGAGLVCPINIEVNTETLAAGPDALLDMMLRTGASVCEFDLSFDFQRFWSAPAFGPGQVPLVPPTARYSDVSAFLVGLRRRIVLRGLSDRIHSHALVPFGARGADLPFNTRSEARFVTLNPDGSVTTIPLYSDIVPTHLGNLHTQSLADCLAHPNRALRMAFENERALPCAGCPHQAACQGGPSHAPLFDGSGECAGLRGAVERMGVVSVAAS